MTQTSVKERLIAFVKFKGSNVFAFERACGLSNGYLKNLRHAPSMEKLSKIFEAYPELSRQWLLTGEGAMLNSVDPLPEVEEPGWEMRPCIPVSQAEVAAGTLSGFAQGVSERDVEWHPFVPAFGRYDFTIYVRGDSMLPDFRHGDEIALRRVTDYRPGEIYVIDTPDGAVLKIVTTTKSDHTTRLTLHSLNPDYADYEIEATEVLAMYRVVGLIRNSF